MRVELNAEKTLMPKQISSLTFIGVVNYIEDNYPKINVQNIVDHINREEPYYVENLTTGRIEHVALTHIKDENYWFSQLFVNAFFDEINNHVQESNFFFNAAESLHQHQHFLKTAVGMPFIGPQKMMAYLQRENDKFNITKDVVLLKSEKGHAVLRSIYFEGIVPTHLGMQWGAGLLRSYLKLSGATNVRVKHTCIEKGPQKPGDKGRGIWEFEVRYNDPGLFTRLFKSLVFSIPIVKREMDHATRILIEHKEQLINRDKLIKEKTEELKRINEKLLELDKQKTEFYTNVTHELRTPLTLIKSQIEAIRQGHLGQKIKNSSEIFDSVSRNTSTLSILIDNILDFSKAESYEMKPSLEKTNLSEFLRYIISNFEFSIKNKKLRYRFMDNPEGLHANLDQSLFEKAMKNLISNAIKFTPSKGQIILSLTQDENDIVIAVEDTGIGIKSEDQEIIFERFRQADSSLTKKYEGTGIGLSLSKRIVELHKGKITVESEPNKGSTFKIFIPKAIDFEGQIIKKNDVGRTDELTGGVDELKTTENDSIRIPFKTESDLKKSSFTILIVEDNDDLCIFLKNIISPIHNVFVSKNGIEALEELDKRSIDIVITDIMMPKMDGVELLKNIRRRRTFSWVPVIMLTARADFEMKMKGFSYGANDYIVKPFEPDELLARINSQIPLVELRREYESEVNMKNRKNLTDKTIFAIERVHSYIKLNFKDDITRESLASVVDMSPDHLSRMFKKHTGGTIKDLINRLRIESSLKRLQCIDKKIVEIAFDVGFESLSSFNRIFKKIKGITPSDYRKSVSIHKVNE